MSIYYTICIIRTKEQKKGLQLKKGSIKGTKERRTGLELIERESIIRTKEQNTGLEIK